MNLQSVMTALNTLYAAHKYMCPGLAKQVRLFRLRQPAFFWVGRYFKAELLQLNRTQFPSLGIFVGEKVGNRKNQTTFIISVLKVVY